MVSIILFKLSRLLKRLLLPLWFTIFSIILLNAFLSIIALFQFVYPKMFGREKAEKLGR